MSTNRTASAMVYVQAELSEARRNVEELKGYLARALDLVQVSKQRDHLFAVGGDIIYGMPACLARLEKSLGAASVAVNFMDSEEQKQVLRPEKIDELERILEDVRLRMPQRRGRRVNIPDEAVFKFINEEEE